MSKQLLFNDEARRALKRGVDLVTDAVKITIGPKGRNVVFDKGYGAPTITNDGVSIAKEITLSNKFENLGAEIVKEVAGKTNDAAGDGTTTSVILTQAIIHEGLKHTAAGLGVMGVRAGIEAATTDVVKALKDMSKPIKTKEEIQQVATISAESEELGRIIAETIEKVGKDGVVTVEESQSFGVTSEVVEGMQFDKGYVSMYMVTNSERMEAEYKDAPILITDKKISSIKDILPLLEKIAATGKKELVIIAEDVDGEALTTLVLNKLRGGFNVLAVKAPAFGDRKKDLLGDIATITGALVISDDVGKKIEDVELTDLGRASKVIATKDSTIIVGGKGSKSDITERVSMLKAQKKETKAKYDIEKLDERIAKLTGGVAVVRVGAATETEMRYLKLKIEDAVNATKAAIEEGIVIGGGSALVRSSQKVLQKFLKETNGKIQNEFDVGYAILIRACEMPLRQIAINGGKGDGSIVVEKVKELKDNGGYNALVDQYIPDMFAAGIIDPVKVTRVGLQNAASAAGILLTTEVLITDEPQKAPSTGSGQANAMDY